MNKDECLDIGMTECFYCREPMDIVMDTRLKKCSDKKLGQHMFGGYEPCNKCKEIFSKGVLVLEVVETPCFENQPSYTSEQAAYPTGRLAVVKTEAINIENDGIVFVTPKDAKEMGIFDHEVKYKEINDELQ